MGIHILKAGILTTVQDLHRIGYQSQGFGVSGVMDTYATNIANILVDNDENEAVIEFTMIGPTLKFTEDAIIAITGGDFQPLVNNKLVDIYKALYINKNDILSFAGQKTGCRGYIAFASKLDVPIVMNSKSTNLKSTIGGLNGKKLLAHSFIPFVEDVRYLPNFLSRKTRPIEYKSTDVTLRVIIGPHDKYFTQKGIETFLSSDYQVTNDCDRMGYRLDGEAIETKTTSDIISCGTTFGCIQVPSDGKPIVLLADRQTTGGYAQIGVIASVDLPKIVQQKPGSKVKFQKISVNEAQNLIQEQQDEFKTLKENIKKHCKETLEIRLVAKKLKTIFDNNL